MISASSTTNKHNFFLHLSFCMKKTLLLVGISCALSAMEPNSALDPIELLRAAAIAVEREDAINKPESYVQPQNTLRLEQLPIFKFTGGEFQNVLKHEIIAL